MPLPSDPNGQHHGGVSEPRDEMAERLRESLGTEIVTEKKMFGAHCFMVNGKLVACANKDGGLLVRVDAARHDELVARPGASTSEMGKGRSMGPGWIRVEPSGVDADEDLAIWLADALDFNRRITR